MYHFSLNGRFQIALLAPTLCASATLSGEEVNAFEKIRMAMLAKFDANGNGRTDPSERETMRQSKSITSPCRSHPPELLAKYDKDKSGSIDGREWDVAGTTESEIIRDKFDQNKTVNSQTTRFTTPRTAQIRVLSEVASPPEQSPIQHPSTSLPSLRSRQDPKSATIGPL